MLLLHVLDSVLIKAHLRDHVYRGFVFFLSQVRTTSPFLLCLAHAEGILWILLVRWFSSLVESSHRRVTESLETGGNCPMKVPVHVASVRILPGVASDASIWSLSTGCALYQVCIPRKCCIWHIGQALIH